MCRCNFLSYAYLHIYIYIPKHSPARTHTHTEILPAKPERQRRGPTEDSRAAADSGGHEIKRVEPRFRAWGFDFRGIEPRMDF